MVQPGFLFDHWLKGAILIHTFYILCPSTMEEYLHLLNNIGPVLDDTGVSFHICRPGEDLAGLILQDKEVNG